VTHASCIRALALAPFALPALLLTGRAAAPLLFCKNIQLSTIDCGKRVKVRDRQECAGILNQPSGANVHEEGIYGHLLDGLATCCASPSLLSEVMPICAQAKAMLIVCVLGITGCKRASPWRIMASFVCNSFECHKNGAECFTQAQACLGPRFLHKQRARSQEVHHACICFQ
jgi:hypothetical protein